MTREPITDLDVRSNSRHSMQVQRYHVWPMLTPQAIDAHVGQMHVVYCCIWGAPSPAVSWYLTFHDIGEADAGDFQFGAKRRFPSLKAASDEVEAAHTALVLDTNVLPDVERPPDPTPEEWNRVKACDMIEGLERALQDVMQGNRLAGPVVNAYREGLAKHSRHMLNDDRERMARYLRRPYTAKLWKHYEDTCT